MARCQNSERCPDEDTDKCEECRKEPTLSELGLEDAIKYFEADIDFFKRTFGDRATRVFEYRVTSMAVDALKDKLKL